MSSHQTSYEVIIWRCCGILVNSLYSQAEGPGSNTVIAPYFCPSAKKVIHIALSIQVFKWGPSTGRMQKMITLPVVHDR